MGHSSLLGIHDDDGQGAPGRDTKSRGARDTSDTGRDVMNRIAHLYEHAGRKPYDGGRRESVTALEHALQCAQLAEWAGADGPLVAAALLHDVGDLVAPAADTDAADNRHELRALEVLRGAFGPEVLDPIRLHVAAKRYLVATEPGYSATLSPASVLSLSLQGGPMSDAEQRRFHDRLTSRRRRANKVPLGVNAADVEYEREQS